MKQILSQINTLIVSDSELQVLTHPTTVFTDDNVMVEGFDKEVFVTGLTSKLIDSTLDQIAEIEPVIDVINLEDSPRTTASDAAVQKLIEKGTTIITIEP